MRVLLLLQDSAGQRVLLLPLLPHSLVRVLLLPRSLVPVLQLLPLLLPRSLVRVLPYIAIEAPHRYWISRFQRSALRQALLPLLLPYSLVRVLLLGLLLPRSLVRAQQLLLPLLSRRCLVHRGQRSAMWRVLLLPGRAGRAAWDDRNSGVREDCE